MFHFSCIPRSDHHHSKLWDPHRQVAWSCTALVTSSVKWGNNSTLPGWWWGLNEMIWEALQSCLSQCTWAAVFHITPVVLFAVIVMMQRVRRNPARIWLLLQRVVFRRGMESLDYVTDWNRSFLGRWGGHLISYALQINPFSLLSTPPPPFLFPGNFIPAGTQVDEGVRPRPASGIVAPLEGVLTSHPGS